jgi:hypothetical protein
MENEKQFDLLNFFTQAFFAWICIVIFAILLFVSLKLFEVFSFVFALSLNTIFWSSVSYFLVLIFRYRLVWIEDSQLRYFKFF